MAATRDRGIGASHVADGRTVTAERRERYRAALLLVSRQALELEAELRREVTDEADAYGRAREMARELVAELETANLTRSTRPELEKAERTIARLAVVDDEPIPLPGGRTQFEGELVGDEGWKPPAGRRA